MNASPVLFLSVFLVVAYPAAFADHRQHGAHVHGVGELLVVLEGDQLEMSFRIPAMDLIGFEHVARTDEQRAAIQKTKAFLRKGDQLFELTGSPECELHRSSALFALTTHDHGEHHDEAKESASGASDQGQDEGGSDHAEFHVKHKYRCTRPQALESIVFKIFEKYDGIDKVNAAYVLSGGQASKTLTADEREIRVKPCRLSIGTWCF
jgi:hypothetical protein